jgi:hypothetical protein
MEMTITTPTLLFSAMSLLMLVYTNRFLAISGLIRNLHEKYKKDPSEKHIVTQINNLRTRVKMIRTMQALGVLSFFFSTVCIFTIIAGWLAIANVIFGLSVLWFTISLIVHLMEIYLSMRALEVELSDIEELSRKNILSELLSNRKK